MPVCSVVGEVALELEHVAREGIGVAVEGAADRLRHPLVRSRRPAEPEVDPAGEQRVERAELLGDHQGRMVGQHDPACADPDMVRRVPDVRDHHRGGGAGDPGHAVMLGHPVAGKAQAFGMAREIGCVGEAPARAPALR